MEGRRNGIALVHIKNNIFYKINGTPIIIAGDVQDATIEGNWEDAGDPFWLDARVSELNVGNQGYPDFNLQPRSQCIDSGAWLTQTTSSGNGHRITVRNAGYFMDGWGMQKLGVKGDMIQMEGRAQCARVLAIDYDTNTITVDKNLAWNKGQGVALVYEGVKPDIGAFEFKGQRGPLGAAIHYATEICRASCD